jgi:hypothetical protein
LPANRLPQIGSIAERAMLCCEHRRLDFRRARYSAATQSSFGSFVKSVTLAANYS